MKVLILGVGSAQVDAIEYCKEKGYEVYGCSYTNTEKGISLLDHFEQLNIVDIDAIKDYAIRENIDIVYSVGSDIAMPTACKVSEDLDLPHFVSYRTAFICNNKHLMRQELGNDFEGNTSFIVAGTKEELSSFTDFPGVIKPVDSQGQRGVYKVNSLDEAKEYFDKSISYSKSGKVILEKYLTGTEVSVNAYFINGVMKFGLVSDRISYSEYPGGIIKEHYVPAHYPQDVQDKALDLARRVAIKLDIMNGPCYFQMKVVDNTPYLLEVTPRFDGCHMWRLIRFYTGVDLLDVAFRHLLFNEINEDDLKIKKQSEELQTVFMCQAPETPVVTRPYEDAYYCRWYYDDGDKVRRMNGYMEKCGYRIEKHK